MILTPGGFDRGHLEIGGEAAERHEGGDQDRHRDGECQHPGQIEADQFEHDPDREVFVNDVVDDFGDVVDDQKKR